MSKPRHPPADEFHRPGCTDLLKSLKDLNLTLEGDEPETPAAPAEDASSPEPGGKPKGGFGGDPYNRG